MTLLCVCAATVLGVFAVMLYSIATFRRGAAHRPGGAPHALAEVLWALVPIAIMVGTALPAVRQLLSPENDARSVQHAPRSDFPGTTFHDGRGQL